MILPTQPPRTGVGFKPDHFDGLIADPGPIGFVEVHAENYMGDGGFAACTARAAAGAPRIVGARRRLVDRR